MGSELRGRTLGLVGFGGIARAVVKLASGFGLQEILAFDPFVDPQVARQSGVRLVGLEELLSQSDFVSVHCPLNDQTRNLIDADQLALMKQTAYVINTARGGIVNEMALYEALCSRRIAGAAIDVFTQEPVTGSIPLATLDNVLLAPHCIAWTDELFRDIGETVCRGLVELSRGIKPRGIVNPEVLDRSRFREKWHRWTFNGEMR